MSDGRQSTTVIPTDLVHEREGSFSVGRRAYFDPDVFATERERVFSRAWLYLAHESEIPDPGDYVTRRLGFDPVIVVRDESGGISVVGNTCRHRGIKLCRSDRGNSSHFRCPYHGWTYSSTGDLTGVTNVAEVFGRDFDKSRFPLFRPAQVASVFGLIFATWDPGAPSLEQYLGDARWYLESIFGGFDEGVSVIGTPVRTVMATNWKPETENLGGDGYHTPVTHRSAFVLGMFAGPDDWEQMGRVVAKAYKGRVVVCGDTGHTFRVHHLPVATDDPAFFGYPEHLWPELRRNLDAGQVDLQARLSVLHGNVFPNFTVLENFKTSTESKGSHTRYIRVTTQYPIAPGRTEMLWWVFVPNSTSAAWRQQSQRAYLRTNGPAGMLQIDDNENFAGLRDAHTGDNLIDEEIILNAGYQNAIADELGWAGTVYDADKTEQTMRAFWRTWREMMGAEATLPVGSMA